MIEIGYKKILFFQAFFLFSLGTFVYNFFKKSFALHDVSSKFWTIYLLVWFGFIVLNLLFIKFFALPTKARKGYRQTTLLAARQAQGQP